MNDWNDGYIIEGLDRLHIVMCNISQHIEEHPAIVKAGVSAKIEAAMDNLSEAYQTVGRLDEIDNG